MRIDRCRRRRSQAELERSASSLPLIGIECRGFELHAGTERGDTHDILFQAQRDKDGKWRFGPRLSALRLPQSAESKWQGKICELQRVQSGYYQ